LGFLAAEFVSPVLYGQRIKLRIVWSRLIAPGQRLGSLRLAKCRQEFQELRGFAYYDLGRPSNEALLVYQPATDGSNDGDAFP
jgi:hypothetical protein